MTRRRRKPEVDHEAEFDTAIADARRALGGKPSPRRAPTVAEQVERVLAHREAARREAQAQADYEAAQCPTGCCRRCGIETCAVVDETGSTSPGWYEDEGGHICAICQAEHDELPWTATPGEANEVIARRLLGIPRLPMLAVSNPSVFDELPVWWFEHPGARPALSIEERFGHLDLDRLGQHYWQIAQPVATTERKFAKREACPVCGTRDRWVSTQVETPQPDGSPPHVSQVWRCQACITSQPWSDTGRMVVG